MSKLVFYYGVMGCSKTANALMLRFQHIERNRKVWLIKPAIDTRDDTIENGEKKTLIKSRVGLNAEATVILPDEVINPPLITNTIVCDEAQFLTPAQVEQLKNIAEYRSMSVYCYGLRTDFRTEMFPGSKRLFELADEIIEIPSVCSCGKNAIVNARINASGGVITEGVQVQIGGDESYKALCWTCWKGAQAWKK